MMQLLLQGFIPSLYDSLGIYIPLIVVNCIILGRAESYASRNPVLPSLFDGIGMGLGFTVGLTLIGIFREILGSGSIFGFHLIPDQFHIAMFVMAPGAFFVLAGLTAIQNKLKMPCATNTPEAEEAGCKAIGGVGMLQQQGAVNYGLFVGKEMPLAEYQEFQKAQAK